MWAEHSLIRGGCLSALDRIYISFTQHSSQTAANMSRPSEADPEKEWMEKLFGECEDEFCETFGVYDGKFET